jgi:glycosyltransferase involved in cell wall biosynthesis
VIVPTRFVADDAVRALRIEPERIDVIPEAPAAVFWPRPVAEIEAVRERFGLPDRYLLWVGGMRTPDPSKRVAALARTPRTLPLVLVGPTSRWARELPGVQLTGQVSDDELAAIYSGAHALVFPGHEDGFGLPAVEALACGTPVAACDGPALREVLEDRIAFSPRDDLAALVRSAELLERPAPAPPPWSWADVAQTTWKVYERALEQGSAVRPARRGGVRRRERVERR